MQHPDFETTDLSRLQIAGVGGAPCALAIMERWAECGVELMQGFGMTETSPGAIFLDPADAMRKIGSTGKELLHTEARIVNEDGEEAGPNEVEKSGWDRTSPPDIGTGPTQRPRRSLTTGRTGDAQA